MFVGHVHAQATAHVHAQATAHVHAQATTYEHAQATTYEHGGSYTTPYIDPSADSHSSAHKYAQTCTSATTPSRANEYADADAFPPVPHPNPGPTPHPTNTPLPTPTQVPLCADLARYDSRSTDDGGGSELVNPPSILKIDSLKVLMDGTECDNASVFIGGLLRTERYHIVLTTTDGLGFHAQCSARRSTGFTNLEGHRTYRYSFPLWACAGGYPHGTITATVVRAPLGNEVATKTYDVMVAPPPPSGVQSIVHEDGCQIEIVAGTPQVAAGRTPDGGAYAVQTTMYMGVPLSTVVMSGLSKQLPKQYCMVGGIETSAVPSPSTPSYSPERAPTRGDSCGEDSMNRRLLTARSILFDVTAGDRFDLSSTHEITFGSHSIELETSTFTR